MKPLNSSKRYEKKYIIPENLKDNVPTLIKNSSLFLVKQFNSRIVNSIYLDTDNLKFYNQNIQGLHSRYKFRIRWYSDNYHAKLEIKIKKGNVGYKKHFPLGVILNEDKIISFEKIKNSLSKVIIPDDIPSILKDLKCILLVSYERQYFKSKIINLRLTLDQNIRYFKISNHKLSKRKILSEFKIIELKYPLDLDQTNIRSFSDFNLRNIRHSKYVNGIKKIYCIR